MSTIHFLAALFLLATPPPSDSEGSSLVSGKFNGDRVRVEVQRNTMRLSKLPAASGAQVTEVRRAVPPCVSERTGMSDYDKSVPFCMDDLYRYPRGWDRVSGYDPTVKPAKEEPFTVYGTDLAVFPIDSGTINIEPPSGRIFVNLGILAHSTAHQQTHTGKVLNQEVEVDIWPVEWEWDFGQNLPTRTTTTPGKPYPDETIKAIYRKTATKQHVTLTIKWAGNYRLTNQTSWQPIKGHGYTTLTSQPFKIIEAPARLVPHPNDP